LAHVGIALATAIAAWVNAGLLTWGLRRRGALVVDDQLRRRLPRMVAASVGMAALLVLAAWALAEPLAGGELVRIPALAVLVVGGLVAYAALAHLIGAANLGEFRALLRRGAPAGRA
jgi:putative peptidoglycan lipid II flippase